jgi:uncharacterized protein (DUF4415 family)
MAKEEKPKEQISVRIDPDDLAELAKLGDAIKPVPLNRNQMVGLAIREYVERHGKAKGKK